MPRVNKREMEPIWCTYWTRPCPAPIAYSDYTTVRKNMFASLLVSNILMFGENLIRGWSEFDQNSGTTLKCSLSIIFVWNQWFYYLLISLTIVNGRNGTTYICTCFSFFWGDYIGVTPLQPTTTTKESTVVRRQQHLSKKLCKVRDTDWMI